MEFRRGRNYFRGRGAVVRGKRSEEAAARREHAQDKEFKLDMMVRAFWQQGQ